MDDILILLGYLSVFTAGLLLAQCLVLAASWTRRALSWRPNQSGDTDEIHYR